MLQLSILVPLSGIYLRQVEIILAVSENDCGVPHKQPEMRGDIPHTGYVYRPGV